MRFPVPYGGKDQQAQKIPPKGTSLHLCLSISGLLVHEMSLLDDVGKQGTDNWVMMPRHP